MPKLCWTILLLSLLTACGQKGPLYLPEPETAEETTQEPDDGSL